jgi:alpha-tubulin suppressor-like RCC1 family protein
MCGSNEAQIGVSRHLKLPNYVKTPILKIAAAGTHCLLIDANHNVWIWGYGLLGKGPKCDESMLPIMIPQTLFGRYEEIPHTLKKKAISVDCGLYSSSVTFDDGSFYMWGKNKYGNLGTGDDLDAYIPLRVNIPARVKKVDMGADQTFAICKTNL